MSLLSIVLTEADAGFSQDTLLTLEDCQNQQHYRPEVILCVTQDLPIDIENMENLRVYKTQAETPSERKNEAILQSTAKYFIIAEEGTRFHPLLAASMLTGFHTTWRHLALSNCVYSEAERDVPNMLDSRLVLGNYYPPVFGFTRELWGALGGFKNILGPFDVWDFYARTLLLEKRQTENTFLSFRLDDRLFKTGDWTPDLLKDAEYKAKAIQNYFSLFYTCPASLSETESAQIKTLLECLA